METGEGKERRAPQNPDPAWRKVFVLLGIVTFGVSQPVFGMIQSNPAPFGTGGGFLLWVILWVQILPMALVSAVEWTVRLIWGEGRAFRIWRVVLTALLALSLIRQLQVGGLGASIPGGAVGGFLLLALAAVLVVAASWRWSRGLAFYLSYLGCMAPVLTLVFAVQMGLFGSAWRSSAPPKPSSDAMPVFVIVFDELSLDVMTKGERIDPERFPRFAALAGESAWFRNATTNDYLTRHAVARMLAGRRDPPPDGDSLLRLVGDRYRVLVSTGMSHIEDAIHDVVGRPGHVEFLGKNRLLDRSPGSVPRILAVGLARAYFLPEPVRGWVLRKGGGWQTIHDVHREHRDILLDRISGETLEGTFVYWHTTLPHAPFVLDRHGRPHGRFRTYEADPEGVMEDYAEQARYGDALLGRIVDALEARGIKDRCWLIVTSDHGLRTPDVPMREDASSFPDRLPDRVVRVPLLIRGPGVEAGIRDLDYQHVDFMPTILDLLGFDPKPESFEGRSAFGADRSSRPKFFRDVRGAAYVLDPGDGYWHLTGEDEMRKN